jgi:DNA polymerase V
MDTKSIANLRSKNYWLPLYGGRLSCGLFGISDDFVESYLSLDEKFLKNHESTFFVRAFGDSMEPEIKNDDILVVDRSLTPKHKSVVAVFYNNSPLCKQLLIIGDKRYLHSFNKKYPQIEITEYDDFQIFGVIIGIARDLV